MTVTTTKQFAFRDALYNALVADAGLVGVAINRGYVDWSLVFQRKSIELGAMFDSTDWSAMGNRKTQETFTLDCRIVAQIESEGNDSMEACETDVQTVFAVVETIQRTNHQMRTNATDSTTYTVDQWIISESNYGPFFNEHGRVGVLEFVITAGAQLPRQ